MDNLGKCRALACEQIPPIKNLTLQDYPAVTDRPNGLEYHIDASALRKLYFQY